MTSRLRELSAQVRELEATLRAGGGTEKVARQHKQGKLTARERVAALCDVESRFLEVGLLVAYDQYERQAPGAGVVTGIGLIHGREVVIVANDATVKAGSWWPETIKKMLRAQEIAMRCRIPIVYLVDSAGESDSVFGGRDRVAVWRIHNDYAALRGGFYINVVNTDACTSDDAQAFGLVH